MSNYVFQLHQQPNETQDHEKNHEQQQQTVEHSSDNSNGNGFISQQTDITEQPSLPSSSSADRQAQGHTESGYQTRLASFAAPQNRQQVNPDLNGKLGYVKLDREAQQNHLAHHQAQHHLQFQEFVSGKEGSTTPMSQMMQTTIPPIENQQTQVSLQDGNENNGYQASQQQQTSDDSKVNFEQNQPESVPMMVNDQPVQVPIIDQQSLIPDPNQEQQSYQFISNDDGPKQQQSQQSQPAGVFQVYQAYYAPRDHKPLPGYVRLSIDEFNELFRDAEIQYVDKNSNGLISGQNLVLHPLAKNESSSSSSSDSYSDSDSSYGRQLSATDMMKAASSENHSILIDRRSIPDGASISDRNSTDSNQNGSSSTAEVKSRLGQAVKKIISIKNSRHLVKQVRVPKTFRNGKTRARLAPDGSSNGKLSTEPSATTTTSVSPVSTTNLSASKSSPVSKSSEQKDVKAQQSAPSVGSVKPIKKKLEASKKLRQDANHNKDSGEKSSLGLETSNGKKSNP